MRLAREYVVSGYVVPADVYVLAFPPPAYKLMVMEGGLSKQAGKSSVAQKSPEELEAQFVRHTAAILVDAPGRSLKAGFPLPLLHLRCAVALTHRCHNVCVQAVELANVLRARMGTDALAVIRESHGGLLSLLEKHAPVFQVDRIPKNDSVSLVAGEDALEEFKLEELIAENQSGRLGTSESWSSSLAIPSRCLHVGNVSVSMTEEKLQQQFGQFGKIESLK